MRNMTISRINLARIVSLLIFVALIVIYILGRQPIANYPSKGVEVIAFGDSLIQGVGSSAEGDLPSLLSKKLLYPVVNLGRAGNTTEQGLLRLKDLDAYNPKIVLLLFGGNDYLHSIPISDTEKNLSLMIENIQARGAIVILLGVRGGIFFDNFGSMFRRLRDKYHVVYVSDVLTGLYGNNNFMSDVVHPNNEGYKVIAERVYPVLKSVLK
jgi:lysophospholipase L1-like esterase